MIRLCVLVLAALTSSLAVPASAAPKARVSAYGEAAQIVGTRQYDDVLLQDEAISYSSLTVGADIAATTRRTAFSASLRYEQRVVQSGNEKTDGRLDGLIRGRFAVVPGAIVLDAGGIATRTQKEGFSALPSGSFRDDGPHYAVFVGPNVRMEEGDLRVSGHYRLGYSWKEGWHGSRRSNVDFAAEDPLEPSDRRWRNAAQVSHSVAVRIAFAPASLRQGAEFALIASWDKTGDGASVQAPDQQTHPVNGSSRAKKTVPALKQALLRYSAGTAAVLPVSRTILLTGELAYEKLQIEALDVSALPEWGGRCLGGIIPQAGAYGSTRRKMATNSANRYGCFCREPFVASTVNGTVHFRTTLRTSVNLTVHDRVSIALTGDGADEAFAGYRRHLLHSREDRVRRALPPFVQQKMLGTLAGIYPKADWAPRFFRAKTTLQSLAEGENEAYASALAFTTAGHRKSLYTEAFSRNLGGYRAQDAVADLMHRAPASTALFRAQYADLAFVLPGGILTKIDRTSMACGLEAREPLLDYRLVEFAALPDGLRLCGQQGKYLLKASLHKHLPNRVLHRRKLGFVSPLAQWLRGLPAGLLSHQLKASFASQNGWFSDSIQQRVLLDHQSGRSDNSRQLWQWLMLDAALTRLIG